MANRALYDKVVEIFTTANANGYSTFHLRDPDYIGIQWSVHQVIAPASGGLYYRNELEPNERYEIASPDEYYISNTLDLWLMLVGRRFTKRLFEPKKEKIPYETASRVDHPTRGLRIKGSKAERKATLRNAQRDKK